MRHLLTAQDIRHAMATMSEIDVAAGNRTRLTYSLADQTFRIYSEPGAQLEMTTRDEDEAAQAYNDAQSGRS